MLEEYVAFVQSVFPSIDPYVAERAIDAIRQHGPVPRHLFQRPVEDVLAQADILSPVLFQLLTEDGQRAEYEGPGLLLSNTCDVAHDDYQLLAVGYPHDSFAELFGSNSRRDLANNEIYHLLFVPEVPNVGDTVFDLSLAQSLPRNQTQELLEGGRRVAQFSELGFYFFVSKMTVHLLRPESEAFERDSLDLA